MKTVSPSDLTPILQSLTSALEEMPPQVRQAATYVLNRPGEVAVASMRAIAEAAEVKPNTLVRMARAVGFDSYEDFRSPFRQQAADGTPSFPDRARFLRSINEGGRHGTLLAEMAAAALGNVESLFAEVQTVDLKAAADLMDEARSTNVLGVGTAKPLADNFAYVASMALDNVTAIPTIGLAIDDVARMGADDVLLAMTFSPCRVEIVEAVRMAVARGVPVISISDSWAAPIMAMATKAFVVQSDSPLPFSSSIAAVALLEVLLAFMMADSPADVVGAIDSFHANRRTAGIYTD
ncbi:MAG: MurR/RpiR family transcriptional regulator [Acidimicrobiaceae bacterium]|nr:MurR/RpiR family transcriptional regulator [Acidimicrobiaceae bacterium]MDE0605816.1 MurR/RpiR family transcriptional regulator [Acidimicrobiaceae bacterium]